MGIFESLIGGAGLYLAGAYNIANAYTMTKQGANPLTLEAVQNILRNAAHYEKARREVNGVITSCYRSERVNAIIGGVKTSDHLKGLACDIVPGKGYSLREASLKLSSLAKIGAIGNVRQVIEESYKGVVHLGYFPAGKNGKIDFLEQYAAGKHKPLEGVG